MLLAIDIGNTSINNGILKDGVLKKRFRIPVHVKGLNPFYVKQLKPYLNGINGIIVASVAPKTLKEVKGVLKKLIDKDVLVLGKDLDSGVKNLYRNPKQVGQDRLVNARAAYELYGGESMIVDFGTAITIDIINKDMEYIGGVIAPGVEISMRVLAERAALLPKITLKRPKAILGKETRQSMISGAVYGFSSLCDGIVQRLKKRYCKRACVIATGGLSSLIAPYCKTIDKIDPELTLKGLALIGAENNV